MTAADFCNDTQHIAVLRAIETQSLALQISPDKNMNCHDTTAGFTVPREFVVFVVMDPKRFAGPALPTRPCGLSLVSDSGNCSCIALPPASMPSSVGRLVVLRSSFLQTMPRGIALAFG